MNGMPKSQFTCPSCGTPLSVASGSGDTPPVQMWCGYGPCKSFAANTGAEGDTEQLAFTALENEVAKEKRDEEEGPQT